MICRCREQLLVQCLDEGGELCQVGVEAVNVVCANVHVEDDTVPSYYSRLCLSLHFAFSCHIL